MDGSDFAELQRRVASLEEALLRLADFAMMTTHWLALVTDEETIALSNRWFRHQLDGILASCDSSPQARDHLLRFARAFEELESAPPESPVHEKMWQDIIEKMRRETESPQS